MPRSGLRRKLVTMRRVCFAGLRSFLRNAWLSTAATIVMMMTLSSILLTGFASVTSNATIESFTEGIDVSIFFKDDATKRQINVLMADLKSQRRLQITDLTYVSKEEAKASFEAENKDDLKTLLAISQTKDAFPASIRVKSADTDLLAEVVTVARDVKYDRIYDKDSYRNDAKRTAIDRLGGVAKFLRNGGMVASIVFFAISILVIFNTIRMTIFNRKNEIDIMQLIGASNWYIRGPFLVEAAIYGLVAGTASSLGFYFVILAQAPKLGDYLEQVNSSVQVFEDIGLLLIPATILMGMLIGGISAYLAIRRHLKLHTIK